MANGASLHFSVFSCLWHLLDIDIEEPKRQKKQLGKTTVDRGPCLFSRFESHLWSCQILRIHPHEGTGLKLIHSVYISEALRPGAVTPLMLFRVVFLGLLIWHFCCS